jgi:hypothetical protein
MEENIFKRIETEKELPKEAKEEVVSNIESAKLAQELTELFGTELFSVLGSLFKTGL